MNLKQILSEAEISFSESNTSQVIISKCFNCGGKSKLYVKPDTGVFNCFKCSERGNIFKLLVSVLGCSHSHANILVKGPEAVQSCTIDDDDDCVSIGRSTSQNQTAITPPSTITFPSYYKPYKEISSECRNYLLGRGLTEAVIKEMDVHDWVDAKRVVFPVTSEGDLLGYLARDYEGNQKHKVLNAKGNFRSYCVWNLDNVGMQADEIVICEGVISAAKCGMNRSVALFGKTSTKYQLDSILSLKPKRIVLCLDIGAESEQIALYRSIISKSSIPVYEVIFDNIKVIKCPNCKSKTEVNTDNENSTCHKCKKEFDHKSVSQLLNKSDFKDAGDFTFSEMEDKIRNAKRIVGGPSSWI